MLPRCCRPARDYVIPTTILLSRYRPILSPHAPLPRPLLGPRVRAGEFRSNDHNFSFSLGFCANRVCSDLGRELDKAYHTLTLEAVIPEYTLEHYTKSVLHLELYFTTTRPICTTDFPQRFIRSLFSPLPNSPTLPPCLGAKGGSTSPSRDPDHNTSG